MVKNTKLTERKVASEDQQKMVDKCKSLKKLVKVLQLEPGWRVKRKFDAPAAFFLPYEDGQGWNSTAGVDSGGRAIIDVHQKEGKHPINVVRWLNYYGKDGLNCRILHLLPIHRGKDATEFFFKSASTTTSGISRKTIFALKFENLEDAGEFQMWWLHLSGRTEEWKKNSQENSDTAEEVVAKLTEDVDVSADIDFFKPLQGDDRSKRKYAEMALKSPARDHGIRFSFEHIFSPSMKSPERKRSKVSYHSSPESVSPTEKTVEDSKSVVLVDTGAAAMSQGDLFLG